MHRMEPKIYLMWFCDIKAPHYFILFNKLIKYCSGPWELRMNKLQFFGEDRQEVMATGNRKEGVGKGDSSEECQFTSLGRRAGVSVKARKESHT